MMAAEPARRLAFAFPGVGTTAGPAEAAFVERHGEQLRPRLRRASEAAGADLGKAVLEPTAARLDPLAEQLLGYAFGCGVADVLRAHGREPAMTAGHSMGLYAALYACGALDFDTGLGLTTLAYRAAGRACPPGSYDLGAVVGFERAELVGLIQASRCDATRIVNSNNHNSHVLAGPKHELQVLTAQCQQRGAFKALLLGVDLPYHHPDLLGAASVELDDWLARQTWSEPRCPIVSPFDQRLLRAPAALREATARNLSTPISWQGCVEAMGRAGIHVAYECGIGATLVQCARFISPAPRFVGLKQLRAELA